MGDTDLVVVLSALSLPHALLQPRKLKSNLVLQVPTPSASPTILPAKKSITRKDALLLSTNTAHTLDMLDLDMLMLDLSDMLSNVKLMLKLTHKFSVMVVSTTDSDMLDFMVDMPTMLSPSPPPSPRPSRLPALRSPPNIALMSQFKEVITPVETCHVVTKVTCTPAVHSIPKVTCEAGVTEIVEHPVYAHHGAYLG